MYSIFIEIIRLGKDTHKFGKQRLWGCIGWGMGSIITGWLIDWFSDGNSSKNYTPAVVTSLMFLTVDFLIIFKINVNIIRITV